MISNLLKLLKVSIILIIVGCAPKEKDTVDEGNDFNRMHFIVAIDASKRIAQRDLINKEMNLIKRIYKAFKDSTFSKGEMKPNYFQIKFLKKKVNCEKYSVYDSLLKLDLSKIQASERKNVASDFEKKLDLRLTDAYSCELFNSINTSESFSDLWLFLNNSEALHFEDTKDNKTNYLFVFTDGYIEAHKKYPSEANRFFTVDFLDALRSSRWQNLIFEHDYGFAETTTKIKNYDVLVHGLTARNKFVYELDLLELLWVRWLSEAGFNRQIIISSKHPDFYRIKIIDDFLNETVKNRPKTKDKKNKVIKKKIRAEQKVGSENIKMTVEEINQAADPVLTKISFLLETLNTSIDDDKNNKKVVNTIQSLVVEYQKLLKLYEMNDSFEVKKNEVERMIIELKHQKNKYKNEN